MSDQVISKKTSSIDKVSCVLVAISDRNFPSFEIPLSFFLSQGDSVKSSNQDTLRYPFSLLARAFFSLTNRWSRAPYSFVRHGISPHPFFFP